MVHSPLLFAMETMHFLPGVMSDASRRRSYFKKDFKMMFAVKDGNIWTPHHALAHNK